MGRKVKKNGSFPHPKGQDLCLSPQNTRVLKSGAGGAAVLPRVSLTLPLPWAGPPLCGAGRSRTEQGSRARTSSVCAALITRGAAQKQPVFRWAEFSQNGIYSECAREGGASGGSDSTGGPLTRGEHSPALLGAAGKVGLASLLPHAPQRPPTEPATRRANHTLALVPGEPSGSLKSCPGQRQGKSRYSWRVSGPMLMPQLYAE